MKLSYDKLWKLMIDKKMKKYQLRKLACISAGYGKQRGWERGNELVETNANLMDGFRELTEEEAKQMELPF